MQQVVANEAGIKLSILLPVLSTSMCLEGMLKILTIDINVPYEILLLCSENEIDPGAVKRINAKYSTVRWINKEKTASTLAAVQRGIREADGHYILMVCGETAGPIIAINQMLELIEEGYDFVSGTRYAAGGRRLGGPFLAVAASKLANLLLFAVAGSAFTDCTTGLKLFRKEAFEKLALTSDSQGWVLAFEMSLKAQLAQLKVGEVANISVDQLYGGNSTCSLDREFITYLKWFLWAFTNLRRASIKHANVPIRRIRIVE